MRRSHLEGGRGDPPYFRQTGHAIYSVLGHEEHESICFPINPNFISYKEKVLNQKYLESLCFHKHNDNNLSREYKNNLLIFYLFLTCYLVISLATWSLLYNSDKIKTGPFTVRMIFLTMILVMSYTVLYFIWKYHHFAYYTNLFFGILGLLIMFYLVLCDENVLSGMFGNDYNPNAQTHTLAMACFIVLLRTITYDNFFIIVGISFITMILMLGCFLTLTSLSPIAVLSDFFILVIFFVIQIIESHQAEMRAKQLFYRKIKEEEALDPNPSFLEPEKNTQNMFNSEIEVTVGAIDKIKQNIKAAATVIMFKDVKVKLKNATIEIEKIKRKIAHGDMFMFNVDKFSENQEMDEQDRAFVLQLCLDQKHEKTQRGAVRRVSMLDVQEKKPEFLAKSYGMEELETVLYCVGVNWKFDIWFVYQTTGSSLSIVAKYLFQKWSLNETFSIQEEVSDRFFQALERSYHTQNAYHNACHAADVLHTLLYFIIRGELLQTLTPLDTMSCIVAALGHDAEHPGVTNRFLINNRDELALQYNDAGVLENMHAYKTYSIMQKAGQNIFQNLSNEDYVKCRKLIIEMILETDMGRHFEILGKFNTRANNLADLSMENHDDKIIILSMGLKCADIGHSAKIPELHEKWTSFVMEEFFKQGDIEKAKGMPVSTYCDRDTTDVYKSQAGFLKNICIPLYEVWCKYLHSEEINVNCLEQLKNNYRSWEEKGRQRRLTPFASGSGFEDSASRRISLASNGIQKEIQSPAAT
ncbi:pde-4_2 [Blepharisma stoltei]|uniref:PDEase domain-containing protein n=1 Tax=Blepharisma stoltei TaxID=1481888 RepID=A0AAU9JGN2_9CILI|nr:unnamed protein product [Blepharisma stoltei]